MRLSRRCLVSLLLLLAVVAVVVVRAKEVRVGAFNVQIFGTAFVGDSAEVAVLVKVILTYDVMLLQEIRNADGTALPFLVEKVNEQANGDYAYTVSARLGRSTSKEQYAYIYRKSRLELLSAYVYADTGDVFEREPYIAKFAPVASQHAFTLVGLHSKPDDAVAELNALVTVFDSLSAEDRVRVLIMGDLNADCSYVTQTEMATLALRTDTRLTWLVADAADTTTTATDCAYDRLIATDALAQEVVPGSAGVFRFDTAFGIDATLTGEVSDHYPVQLQLQVPVSSPSSSGPAAAAVGGAVAAVVVLVAVLLFVAHRRRKTRAFFSSFRNSSNTSGRRLDGVMATGRTTTMPTATATRALPPGWTAHVDAATGAEYFYDSATNVSSWERPL